MEIFPNIDQILRDDPPMHIPGLPLEITQMIATYAVCLVAAVAPGHRGGLYGEYAVICVYAEPFKPYQVVWSHVEKGYLDGNGLKERVMRVILKAEKHYNLKAKVRNVPANFDTQLRAMRATQRVVREQGITTKLAWVPRELKLAKKFNVFFHSDGHNSVGPAFMWAVYIVKRR